MKRELAIIVLSSALTACGGNSETVPVAVDSIGEELARVYCEKLLVCGEAYSGDGCYENAAGTWPTDQAACETAMLTSDCVVDMEAVIQLGEAEGRLEYDGTGYAECLVEWQTEECDAFFSFSSNEDAWEEGACGVFITPLVADGDFCEIDWECLSGECTEEACAAS